MTNASIEVPLECGHVQRYRVPYPKAGEVAYCRKCGDWTKAIESVEQPARIHCCHCRYNRNYPLTLAQLQARAHAHRHPNHLVEILDMNGEIVQTHKGLQPLLFHDGQSLRDIQKNQAELLRRIGR